jgi:hypothetical protein
MGLLDSFTSSLGTSLGGSILGSKQSTDTSGSTQKVLTQEGIDKLVYDVLSSDQGLAALASGESASGGFGSSTKSLMAQDLVTKLVGELANVTAPTVTNTQTTQKKKGLSVICTELHRQGYIEDDLYQRGSNEFYKANPTMARGYQYLAQPIVRKMQTSSKLCEFFIPWALARYDYVLLGKNSWRAAVMSFLGEPLCFVVGLFIPTKSIYSHHMES